MDRGTIRPERTEVPACIHCEGSGYVEDLVEVTFDEFETEFVRCCMCFGSGIAMTKAERKAHRSRA